MTTFDSTRVDADITLSAGNLTATHSTSNALSATVSNGGTTATYAVNDILTVSGGTFTTAAQFKVTAVSSGSVTTVALQTAGSYTVTPANPAATTGGLGAGCTLTVTYTGENAIAPGNGFHSSGGWSFTITVGTISAGHTGLGMASAGTATGLNNFLGQSANSFGVLPTGSVTINSGAHGTTVAYGASAAVDFAVDLTNALLWTRTNGGNWNGSAANSPGGLGGVSLSLLSTLTLSPAVGVYTLNDSATLNTLPNLGLPGFPNWDPPVAVGTDGATVTNLSGASGSFILAGGAYSFDVVVTGGGTIALQQLGPDGTTWVNSFNSLSATGVQEPLFLPPGTYRFNGGTGNYTASVQRVKFA